MTATRMTGSERLFSTSAIMMKIATIEMVLTVAKSTEVMLIRPLVQAASPTSSPSDLRITASHLPMIHLVMIPITVMTTQCRAALVMIRLSKASPVSETLRQAIPLGTGSP